MPSRSALNQIRSSGPEPRRCGHFAAPNFSCRNDGFVRHGELGMSPGFRSRSLDHTGIAFEAVTLIFLFGNRFVPPRTQSLAAKSPAEGFDDSRIRAADRVNLTKRASGRGRYGGGSVGSKPQTPIERNWPHCGINAR
jgi:hypothetical protein